LKEHPQLSVTVKNSETEKPYYTPCSIIDLEKHIDILPVAKETSDLEAIEKATPSILDGRLPKNSPPWKIIVLPLMLANDERPSMCFIAFAFSHALGDGISGLAFHKSFFAGLRNHENANGDEAADGAMPKPFDTAKNMPISWSYLLAPALGAYLPKAVAKALGFRAAVSTVTSTTWVGNDAIFLDADYRSGARLFALDTATVSRLVQECRKHDTKLTSLFHQVIVYALSNSLPEGSAVDNFASQTAINMRHHVKTSNDEMGLYVTGYFDVHPRTKDTSKIWESANEMNKKLHECSNTFLDQSVGLLRYVPSMRSWIAGKIGARRDSSYEVSNLLAFEPGVEGQNQEGKGWSLENMVFAQPANVTGSPLDFNFVARKGQDLVCSITWQIGALGVGDEKKEYEFVDNVRKDIIKSVQVLTA
jgi:hypothetical protein